MVYRGVDHNGTDPGIKWPLPVVALQVHKYLHKTIVYQLNRFVFVFGVAQTDPHGVAIVQAVKFFLTLPVFSDTAINEFGC